MFKPNYVMETRVTKTFRYQANGGDDGKAAIIIDREDATIDIEDMSGPPPYARDIILFLLSDRHMRTLIQQYQERGKRKELYALRASTGSSGRQDIYINYYNAYGLQLHGKKNFCTCPAMAN